MRLRPLVVMIAALAAAAAPASAEAASAKKKMIWGPVTLPGGGSAFDLYDELGVDVFQIQLNWAQTAPTQPSRARSRQPDNPAYRWPAQLDRAVREAQARDIEVAIMIKNAPGWANGGRSPAHAPSNPIHFARFATAASRRYPGVRFWMVWGEPNLAGSFEPMPANSPRGPRAYADLLDAAYVALKKRSRRNRVIGGMTYTYGVVEPRRYVKWLKRSNGRPPRMDFYGHNPFTYRFPDVRDDPQTRDSRDMSDVDSLYRDVRRRYRGSYRQYRRRTPRLWLSEFTVSSDRNDRAFGFHVSREEQARWLRAAYAIANDKRYIYSLGWFSLMDEPVGRPGGLTTGLMTYESERKPSFDAFRSISLAD